MAKRRTTQLFDGNYEFFNAEAAAVFQGIPERNMDCIMLEFSSDSPKTNTAHVTEALRAIQMGHYVLLFGALDDLSDATVMCMREGITIKQQLIWCEPGFPAEFVLFLTKGQRHRRLNGDVPPLFTGKMKPLLQKLIELTTLPGETIFCPDCQNKEFGLEALKSCRKFLGSSEDAEKATEIAEALAALELTYIEFFS